MSTSVSVTEKRMQQQNCQITPETTRIINCLLFVRVVDSSEGVENVIINSGTEISDLYRTFLDRHFQYGSNQQRDWQLKRSGVSNLANEIDSLTPFQMVDYYRFPRLLFFLYSVTYLLIGGEINFGQCSRLIFNKRF